MERSRRRSRGVFKGKIMPLYKAMRPAPFNLDHIQYRPVTPSTTSTTASYNNYVRSTSTHPPNFSSFLQSSDVGEREEWEKKKVKMGAGEESIDERAATYISSVLQRFKLETVDNSERLTVINIDAQ